MIRYRGCRCNGKRPGSKLPLEKKKKDTLRKKEVKAMLKTVLLSVSIVAIC
jgi:hypothetical protein